MKLMNFRQRAESAITGRLRDLRLTPAAPSPAHPPGSPETRPETMAHASISGTSGWADLARMVASGQYGTGNLRRTREVAAIVETVGTVDGRHYAGCVREWGGNWLRHPGILRVDAWGRPPRWPGWLLGTPGPFSPTTLRYLATGLWLARSGLVPHGSRIVELGVGFGGLAAVNALVSGATTILVDLPAVEQLARRMLAETGLDSFSALSGGFVPSGDFCFVSNYAYTELNRDAQEAYFETIVRHAPRGLILSNAAVFAERAGGCPEKELLEKLRQAGIRPQVFTSGGILGPGDEHCGVHAIHWGV